jgi:hypothetical protein
MNRIVMKSVLCLAAVTAFALPVYAQHSHGAGADGHGASMEDSHSAKHGNSSADSHSSGAKTPDQQLSNNTKLSNKLQGLLPTGTNVQLAAQGFKNLGQFVAAVHVSHNLGIPFDQLKTKMIGPPKESLGKAIHALKPTANSREETKKGEKQAKQDIDDSQTS